jgi:mannose-6-phosphate isomerase-like protein (cupin superfamily)
MGVVNLAAALATFDERWAPRRVAKLNDYEVKVVKVEGDFTWHTHTDTDELFLVIEGELIIQLRSGDVVLKPGELYVVPRGVEHCPRALKLAKVLLLEPAGVINTGDAGGPQTRAVQDLP